jgi:hypothetical protein
VTHLPTARQRRDGRLRRRGAAAVVLLGLLLGWSILLPSATATADADKSNVHTVNPSTAPLAPGQSAWVAVVWTADRTVTNWSTTVTAPAGVTVSYPTTRGGSDTSLFGSATLVGGTRDFTAVELAVPYSRRGSFSVTMTSTYTPCGDNGQCKDQGGGNDNRTSTTSATVLVPVLPASGVPFTQQTTTVTLAAGTSSFQQIAFTGGQTDLADFTVRAGALPAGLQVAYPGDRTASTLNGGRTLRGRSTDYVGVRFVATDLRPGTYTVPLTISYTAAVPVTTAGTVTLVVS